MPAHALHAVYKSSHALLRATPPLYTATTAVRRSLQLSSDRATGACL